MQALSMPALGSGVVVQCATETDVYRHQYQQQQHGHQQNTERPSLPTSNAAGQCKPLPLYSASPSRSAVPSTSSRSSQSPYARRGYVSHPPRRQRIASSDVKVLTYLYRTIMYGFEKRYRIEMRRATAAASAASSAAASVSTIPTPMSDPVHDTLHAIRLKDFLRMQGVSEAKLDVWFFEGSGGRCASDEEQKGEEAGDEEDEDRWMLDEVERKMHRIQLGQQDPSPMHVPASSLP
ncbi:hypothetical protein CVT25_002246 [Psilocybe cyanescens]|uniref:Uncharacterized protein n=1 Tax=Psilocybe cyanescens TaxID=93625 RepID=A0A409X5M9_PSICY|nr:hypothetical protein CVT25_002246 [Psilocybe cyanescens]